ncbi:MAG: thiol:disulfide interchange protein DsbA/DsbL [Chromatiales bacterium]|nr:thiol:disulfide interchange protein DsbA/DsbL [Chromatiales bacterium]
MTRIGTTRIRLLLLAAVLSIAAACGKAPAPEAAAPAAATAEGTPPAAIAAPTPAPEAATDAVPAAVVEESAGTETAAPADSGALGKDIVLADNSSPAPARTDWQYQEGQHFNKLTSAQGTSSSPGKIEVAEVFWYGCSHCYNLEPVLSDWVKKLPADVSFVRIPVMWNPTNEIHGRIYYTAEALGKLDRINPAMFKAIHVENRPMTEEKDILAFFEQNGVSAADFNKTFRSFAVESQLKRAKDLTVKYKVRGVPLLVVDGKYTTDGPQIRSHQDLLAVTEELIQRERQKS